MESECKSERKPNPRENANPISALLFLYMFPVFKRNFKKGLKEEDLCEVLKEHKASTLGNRLEVIYDEEHRKHAYSSLHRSLFRLFGSEFIVYGILQLLNEIMLVTLMPIAVGNFVFYFENGASPASKDQAYMYAGLLIINIIIDVFINHSTAMGLMHMSMKMDVACSSLIYRKCLKLSQSTLSETSTGHIINLLSNDVGNFEYGFMLIHYTWIAPIQSAIAIYLLYRVIGVSAFSGISFLLLFIPLQIYFGKKKSEFRLRTASRTDERVGLMNEILHAIQVIKMYTWEKPFVKLIALARKLEIKQIRSSFFLDAVTFSLETILPGISTFITIVVYISLGNNVTASTVYSIMAIYDAIRPTITIMFSEAISNVAQVHVSVRRIHKFLEKIDLDKPVVDSNPSHQNGITKTKHVSSKVALKNVDTKWLPDAPEFDLTNVNMDIEENQLVAVVGPVGSGKSTLLNVILKELPIYDGSINITGKISYASQDVWLFSGSVRQNILFGNAYDEDRYRTVLGACALESDLASFPYGDRTLVGENGKALSGGQKSRINLARCIYKRADIYLLDDPLAAVDSKVGKHLYEECIEKFLHGNIRVLITHQIQYLKRADRIFIMDEGTIVGEGQYDDLRTSVLDFAKVLRTQQSQDETDYNQHVASKEESVAPKNDNLRPDVFKEEIETGSIKTAVYGAYFKSGGNVFVIFLLALCFVASQSVESANDYYISHWVNLEQEFAEKNKSNFSSVENDELNRDIIIYTYTGIMTVTVALALGQSLFFFSFFMRASINLHNTVFANISRATMRFFNLNPTGSILNRFSEDLGEIDDYIPEILADVVQIALQLVGAVVVSSIVNPWLLLPSAVLLILFGFLRNVYMETSRSVKRIEGTTRSPIFSHVSATLQGISTIRSFLAQAVLKEEFDGHLDFHSSAWFLFITSSTAFSFWIDLICGLFVSAIVCSLIIFNRDYYGGEVGLVVTEFLSLTGVLQWGMHQWSELENHMTSVERVLQYKKIETEPIRKCVSNVPKIWPEYGKIVFDNVSMRYNPFQVPVLKNLNFTINSGEKVGVVGRTGAGKSSIIAALFQLYDIDGSIIIDDVDTTKLPLEVLRSKISIIPQEPVLFSGTIRKNLDPFEEYGDEVLWSALEQVELKEDIVEEPEGLNCNVTEGGSNFSVGQRQLVCLARAVIRNNQILVMDEATANVDPQTDSLIQETIRKRFGDCTVITIAHRLRTIMDSDKVLVVDDGTVIEFDHPYALLQNSDGIFYKMVRTTGAAISQNLHFVAEKNYNKTTSLQK